ncbi:DUF2336 domain-containing protein [Sinorhizobium sp. BG8]|uniref:DUF2336 domain-containing protein n=1 Tax=Sinorhizobium sp. BG8 TaxID=2613773 RepID=UPI00193EBD00|nr:DUF2336 domain-containing protein [Sinorhizobium sp. BG8]QRM54699.1 DUF2336 domain-containing protein [Sinorhizobium sp. BG8]
MADRFRELERPQSGRKKDIVLMATVSSFESLRHPSRSDLLQFSELFEKLYLASSDEARRQAVAALSQCRQVPEATALFIGSRPINIAAIFLTRSESLTDAMLIRILKAGSSAHARAIARRKNLSPAVIEALVGNHQDQSSRQTEVERERVAVETRRLEREERLREDLRALARADRPAAAPSLLPASEVHQALLVRFARSGETGMLAVALADALASSQWLSERILLDLSGHQLAATLVALRLDRQDAAYILSRIYPHLAGKGAGELLAAQDPAHCAERVASWQRADHYTNGDQPQPADAGKAREIPAQNDSPVFGQLNKRRSAG